MPRQRKPKSVTVAMTLTGEDARLRDEAAGFERWLRADVVPTYDRFKADPDRGLSADEVLARLRQGRERRAKTAAE